MDIWTMRASPRFPLFCFALGLGFTAIAGSASEAPAPVTPDALPEVRALLQTLHDISGRYTLTGQHNYPNTKSRNSEFAARYIGKVPAVFSSDWGHAQAGNSDSYLARPDIVQEAIRQHQRGALVTLCWHAVPPTADEPITFAQQPGSDPAHLKSVQGKLLDEQFQEVLTPGTPLYEHWCKQVDAIAVFLKQLEDAHVPVLWRPYHEMNGDWFWWGGRTGQYSTAALYRQIFDRLVHHHHLKNLIWVWSMDRASKPGMEHEKYFPGIEYVDVLGLDVYGNDFAQSYYDSLVKLSQGKPLALAEVGNPPSADVMAKQPLWTYYVTWAGMVRNTSKKAYADLVANPRFLGLNDPAYAEVMSSYRAACHLPPVRVELPAGSFAGTWTLNDEKSEFGRMGAGFVPARLDVALADSALTLRSTRVVEFADDEVTDLKLPLDGTEVKTEFMNSPRETRATLSADGRELTVDSTIRATFAGRGVMETKEVWHLINGGSQLQIDSTMHSPRGEQKRRLVYDRH